MRRARAVTRGVSLTPEVWAMLDELAAAEGRTRSNYLAWLVTQAAGSAR